MRRAYKDRLNDFNHSLLLMADFVRTSMTDASSALLNADIATAERVISNVDTINELREKGESSAFQLLALESPVARDLRYVISGLHIVDNFVRMAALSMHVAKVARRRHPAHAVPEPISGYFAEMSRLGILNVESLREILDTVNVEQALQLGKDDDAVDDIHHHLFQLTTEREWPFSTREAVDVTLLSRYYERYSDHAVSIADRVIYMGTGQQPKEYRDELHDKEIQDMWGRSINPSLWR